MPVDAPIPLQEANFHRFWGPDVTDALIPAPGFVSDFVLALRGTEAPTVFCVWSALWAVSSMLKREAWFDWAPTPLYPNLYIVLVAPPRLCAKSTVARWASTVCEASVGFIDDAALREIKRVNLLRSKASPESLSLLLEPTMKNVKDAEDEYQRVRRYPQVAMMVSELTTFLGRQKYNVGLIDRLTDLFDCADSDDITISRGIKRFNDTYVTLLGATTPDKLRISIPDEAFGGGFMSRTIVVWQEQSERKFPTPRAVRPWGVAQWRDELGKRLAWIAVNAQGMYRLEEDAWSYYKVWYEKFHASLHRESDEKKTEMRARLDSHLLKVALLIRAQRYEPGQLITIEDLKSAERLLQATFKSNDAATEDVGVPDFIRKVNLVARRLQRYPVRTRQQLLQSISRDVSSLELTQILEHLRQSGKIMIRLNGEDTRAVTSNGNEIYSWKE